MGLFRKLQNKPVLFLSTTGTRLDRFESLLPAFEQPTFCLRPNARAASSKPAKHDSVSPMAKVVSGLVNLRAYNRITLETGLDLLEVRF